MNKMVLVPLYAYARALFSRQCFAVNIFVLPYSSMQCLTDPGAWFIVASFALIPTGYR